MSELIKRKDAILEMFRFKGYIGFDEDMLYRIEYALNQIPTIDAVPVVRCRECKHYIAGFECIAEGDGIERDPDWFCADGERKEAET